MFMFNYKFIRVFHNKHNKDYLGSMTTDFNFTNMTQFDKQTRFQRQNKNVPDKTLSPWLGKRRYGKSIRNQLEMKMHQQQKYVQTEKTQQFLKKIFPRKKNHQPDKITQPLLQPNSSTVITSVIENVQQENGSSFVFLPIKPINFQKINSLKQNATTERKKQHQKMSINQQKLHPQIFDSPFKKQPHTSQQHLQSPKACPMVFTFRKSWRKKQRTKTEPILQMSERTRKRLSIDQIYELIGKKTKNIEYNYTNYNNYDNQFQDETEKEQKSASWLIHRSLKKNKNNVKYKSVICKTQYM